MFSYYIVMIHLRIRKWESAYLHYDANVIKSLNRDSISCPTNTVDNTPSAGNVNDGIMYGCGGNDGSEDDDNNDIGCRCRQAMRAGRNPYSNGDPNDPAIARAPVSPSFPPTKAAKSGIPTDGNTVGSEKVVSVVIVAATSWSTRCWLLL